MRTIENRVRAAIDAGETVNYEVTPIYRGSDPIPVRIQIKASGSRGFSLDATIENSPNASPPVIRS
jgi:hypothetical protein